jgi:DNA-binding transcriptional MocR family regulator
MDFIAVIGDWSAGLGPLHRKLEAALSDAIARGALPGGTRLPSERLFASQLAISRSTVVAAYEGLRAAALAESRHGSGTYVAQGRAPRLTGAIDEPGPGAPIFQRLLAEPDPAGCLISFACATMPGQPAIARAMTSFPRAELTALLADTGYLPRGLPSLRAALASLLTTEGLATAPSEVLVTTGAHQAVALCASLLVRPGDTVVVENPSYPGCVDSFAAAGARLAGVPLDDEGMVVDELERVLSRTTVAAIYTMPTFQNPTGTLMSERRRRRLAHVAARHDVAVIEDNALAHVHFGDVDPVPPVAAFTGERAPVITIGSVSKSLWGGLRVGWLRAPQPLLDRLARRKVEADLGSGILDQAIAARLLGDFTALQAANAKVLRDRIAHTAALLRDQLPEWTWSRPRGGPALWIKLPCDATPFSQLTLRHGVELVPGRAFGRDGSFSDHVRLPFTVDPTVMTEAVGRLAAAWGVREPWPDRPCDLDAPALVV